MMECDFVSLFDGAEAATFEGGFLDDGVGIDMQGGDSLWSGLQDGDVSDSAFDDTPDFDSEFSFEDSADADDGESVENAGFVPTEEGAPAMDGDAWDADGEFGDGLDLSEQNVGDDVGPAVEETSAEAEIGRFDGETSGIVHGSLDDVMRPIFRFFDDFWYALDGQADVVTEHHFVDNGSFDVKNNVIVEGNVAEDIKFIDQQTHNSCSLMAQEQFVERYTGQPIPEDYLEWRAKEWGVYDPDIGTDVNGQTMILEHFHIPHERHFESDLADLDNALRRDNDLIVSVDARSFYDNPSIPPGSGHAVAVVGRGVDPDTNEVKGYYVTDSNVPGTAHFVEVDRLKESWYRDMIVIPNKHVA